MGTMLAKPADGVSPPVLSKKGRYMYQNYPSKIKTTREDKGLTQEQLAEMADISVSALRRIEIGLAIPSIETLAKIVKSLSITWSYLLD